MHNRDRRAMSVPPSRAGVAQLEGGGGGAGEGGGDADNVDMRGESDGRSDEVEQGEAFHRHVVEQGGVPVGRPHEPSRATARTSTSPVPWQHAVTTWASFGGVPPIRRSAVQTPVAVVRNVL
ncbi:hypothetical protein GCM10010255_83030 [Streptomyces coeruleofuscus]|uniref:Uncharacterized protein n=1 Tax=Streptomyces coeruleofuscus TaxID=66879 RepID=A0ABP5WLC0_9ACTN